MSKYDLTKEQEKAITQLKRALMCCKKSGLALFDNYGRISAFNQNVISVLAPDETLSQKASEDIHYFQVDFDDHSTKSLWKGSNADDEMCFDEW